MKNYISSRIQSSIDTKKLLLSQKHLDIIENISITLKDTVQKGNRIFLCGNGGSSSDAQHIATELSGRFYKNRKAMDAMALGTNPTFVTAVANDFGYNQVFSRELEAHGRKDDALIAISTSGNSENIIHAISKAKEIGIKTIAFTGESGGKMKELCDTSFMVPSNDVPRIQECHLLTGHIICEYIEDIIFNT